MNGNRFRAALGVALAVLVAALAPLGAVAQGLPEIRNFQSAKIAMEVTVSMLGFDVKTTGSGEMALPDAARVSLSVMGQPIEVITVGGQTYTRSAVLGDPNQWYVQEGGAGASSPSVNPLEMLAAAGSLRTLTQLPDEAIDGSPTEHYRAELDPALLDRIGAAAAANRPGQGGGMAPTGLRFTRATMDLWVARETRYVVQQAMAVEATMSLSMPAPAGSPAAAAAGSSTQLPFTEMVLMRYSHFDEPVEIAPPAGAIPYPSGR